MTLTQLLSLSRLLIPEIKTTDVVGDSDLTIILNNACREFIKATDALPTSKLFNLVLNLSEYSLSTYVNDYGKIRKEGLWFYNKSSGKWIQLDATTIPYLALNYPSYLNSTSSNPLRYSIDGDILLIHPPSSAIYAGTNYLKLFYYARSVDMTNGSSYPFSGSLTLEYTHLADYEEDLILYVKYKVKPLFKKMQDAEEAKEMFYAKCADVKVKLLARPDLIPWMRAQGAGGLPQAQNAFKG